MWDHMSEACSCRASRCVDCKMHIDPITCLSVEPVFAPSVGARPSMQCYSNLPDTSTKYVASGVEGDRLSSLCFLIGFSTVRSSAPTDTNPSRLGTDTLLDLPLGSELA